MPDQANSGDPNGASVRSAWRMPATVTYQAGALVLAYNARWVPS